LSFSVGREAGRESTCVRREVRSGCSQCREEPPHAPRTGRGIAKGARVSHQEKDYAEQPPDAGRAELVTPAIHDRFRRSGGRLLRDGDDVGRWLPWGRRPGLRRRLRSAPLGPELSQEAPGTEV